jgi:hypothetical protein
MCAAIVQFISSSALLTNHEIEEIVRLSTLGRSFVADFHGAPCWQARSVRLTAALAFDLEVEHVNYAGSTDQLLETLTTGKADSGGFGCAIILL